MIDPARDALPRRLPWFRRRRRTAIVLFAIALTLVLDFATATILRAAGLVRFDRLDSDYRTAHPIYSHTLRPSVECTAQWGAARYPMRTNSLGGRDFAVRQVAASPDQPRVLLIGDSFTEGIGAAYEDSFAGILTQRLASRGVEVLNAGCASYSPWIYHRKVRHLAEQDDIAFDHVVVCVDASDVDDEARRVAALGVPSAQPCRSLRAVWQRYVNEHSVLFGSVSLLTRSLRGAADQARAADWRAALDNPRCKWALDDSEFERSGKIGAAAAMAGMDELASFLRSRGIPWTVVVYPWPDFVAVGSGGRHVAMWRDWCAARGVTFIDCCPRFFAAAPTAREGVERFFIPGDVHFNPAGNRLVAECIEAGLPATIPRSKR